MHTTLSNARCDRAELQLYTAMNRNQEEFETSGKFRDQIPLLNKLCSTVYISTNGGLSFNPLEGSTYCHRFVMIMHLTCDNTALSCLGRTTICPHKISLADTVTMPRNVTQIKFGRPRAVIALSPGPLGEDIDEVEPQV